MLELSGRRSRRRRLHTEDRRRSRHLRSRCRPSRSSNRHTRPGRRTTHVDDEVGGRGRAEVLHGDVTAGEERDARARRGQERCAAADEVQRHVGVVHRAHREVAERVDAVDRSAELYRRLCRVEGDGAAARNGDRELGLEVGDRRDVEARGIGRNRVGHVDVAPLIQRVGRRRRPGLRDDVTGELLHREALRRCDVPDVRVGRALDVMRREGVVGERDGDLARHVGAGDVEAEDRGAGQLRRRRGEQRSDVAVAGAGDLEVGLGDRRDVERRRAPSA